MNRAMLKQTIIAAEGQRLTPYTDTAGKLTIGVGRNLTDVGISLEESNLLLEHDLDTVQASVQQHWPSWATLDDVRQRAVLEMAFNLGVGGLLLFKHMLAALAIGDWHRAAQEARRSGWYHQVGPRGERIAVMLETGADPT